MSESSTPGLTLIAAVARNGVIGNSEARIADGAPAIPWRLPGELAEFKALTMGGVLVMGRATYDTIGRPLPGRSTVVVTRDTGWTADGVTVAHSLDEVREVAATLGGEVFIAGGAQIYAAALPHASRQILTRVPTDAEGDVLYPPYDADDWTETDRDQRETYDRVYLTRRTTPC